MFIQITTTNNKARNLGYLLGKHPDKVQVKDLPFGKAHVFFPEATDEKCTSVMMLDIDAIALSRQRSRSYADSFKLDHYVNDRPYSVSSFMSTAISKVFGSALNGNCKAMPELVEQKRSWEVVMAAVPVRGGEEVVRAYFEPLGYDITLKGAPLDERFPEWGESPYYWLRLEHPQLTLQSLLSHIYVLIPVLDNNKHYYISEQEIAKLLAKGHGWLEKHPEVEQITRRYFKYRSSLSRKALSVLQAEQETTSTREPSIEGVIEKTLSLHQTRHEIVVEQLLKNHSRRVLDLGCSSGKLVKRLLQERQLEQITGLDVSASTLEIAKKRLNWEEMSPQKKERVQLLHGSLTYQDERLEGYDAAVAVEVIEHFDPPRLQAFEQSVFKYAAPSIVIITTPNREYNALFEHLPAGKFRHSDHRFEWTREEFESWGKKVAERYHYSVVFSPIGPVDDQLGAPSQMGVFKRVLI
jgi:3' terminal RNA ribose 2'-O-methyltransferase Hen1